MTLEDEDEDEALEEARVEEFQRLRRERWRYISPQCCEPSIRTRLIVIVTDGGDRLPCWRLRGTESGGGDDHYDLSLQEARKQWWRERNDPWVPDPTHCLFCGTVLPAIVKRQQPPEPLCRTDGDYCLTCNEEEDCTCWPPWFAYEAAHPPSAADRAAWRLEQVREPHAVIALALCRNAGFDALHCYPTHAGYEIYSKPTSADLFAFVRRAGSIPGFAGARVDDSGYTTLDVRIRHFGFEEGQQRG